MIIYMAEESKGEGLPEVTEGMRERSIQPHTSGSSESKQINLVLASTRMNPPTPGHMRVLEELIMQGIQKETNEVYVVLSKKNNDEYNPMNCKDKIYYLNGFNENEQKNKANFGSYKDDSMVFALKREMIKKINNTKPIFECVDERQFEPFDKVRDIIQNKLSMLRIDDGQTLGDDRRENEENIGGCAYDSMTNALKREMIEKINNMKVIFECVDETQIGPFKQIGPFHKVRDIIQNKLSMRRRGQTLGIYLVVGDDRSETLDNMKKIKINGQKLNENIDISTFEQIVIKREDSGDFQSMSPEVINNKKISPNQISGTLVRKLATDNPEKFLEIYSDYISDDKKRSLLGNINEGLSRISREISEKRQNIIRKTSSEQKRATRKKKGGVSKKLRRRKTVKNKRKFRKNNNKTNNNKTNNNKTKNNEMKNRRRTRKHK